MPEIAARFARPVVLAGLLAATCLPVGAGPADHLAPGFQSRPAASRLLVLPADIELYSISAGGVAEPRADWTAAAQRNFGAALEARRARLGADFQQLEASQAEEFAEIVTLQRAVAQAIAMHHDNGMMSLATKGDRLDWSMGDAVRPLQERTGADYALFTWIRDSYASGERKALMLGMALLGGISVGGEQLGHALLVDLKTGRVVWFNELNRMTGDLREPAPARETVEALLRDFPGLQ